MSRLEYACAKCRRLITNWTAEVQPNGRIILSGHCHGETETKVVHVDMAGVMFSGVDPRALPSRDPIDFIDV